jgi:hypothetical protein
MQFSKSTLLSVLGLMVMLIFIAMAYFNDHIFLNKILVSGFILGLIFIFKILDGHSRIDQNSDQIS